MLRFFLKALLLLATMACLAAAQQGTPSAEVSRQSLGDAGWTGPLLAPSANTLPRGHILIEPSLYDVISQGYYDSSGTRHRSPHSNGFGSLTYINYGKE